MLKLQDIFRNEKNLLKNSTRLHRMFKEYGASKEICKKEETKCINIIKQYKND